MTVPASARTLAEDLLARAADDWLSVSEVMDIMLDTGVENRSTLRDLAIGLIARLLAEGLIVAGDIEGGAHVPWPVSPGEAVIRIASEWVTKKDPSVMPGEIAWLNTTARGQEIGEAVWAREGNA